MDAAGHPDAASPDRGHAGPTRAGPGDRGSALVLMVLVGVALTIATITALVPVLAELQQRQRARSAADAAALAGVVEGRAAASELAAANGAVLVGWRDGGDTVTVTVRVGDRTAVARATVGP